MYILLQSQLNYCMKCYTFSYKIPFPTAAPLAVGTQISNLKGRQIVPSVPAQTCVTLTNTTRTSLIMTVVL